METGNTIIDRILQCLDMIDNLPEEDRQALAKEYWEFVDQRHAARDAHKAEHDAGVKRWVGPAFSWSLPSMPAIESPMTSSTEALSACYYSDYSDEGAERPSDGMGLSSGAWARTRESRLEDYPRASAIRDTSELLAA